jgi:hypothetical protein
MASTYTAYLDDQSSDPRNVGGYNGARPTQPSFDASHLSPPRGHRSNSGSPSNTPAESVSTLSHYQSSDFSEHDGDPFFGVNFNDDVGTPAFLEEPFEMHPTDSIFQQTANAAYNHIPYQISSVSAATAFHGSTDSSGYPLTPEQTASMATASPRSLRRTGTDLSAHENLPDSVSPQELQKPFSRPEPIAVSAMTSQHIPPQLTPQSGRSSEDGLAPAQIPMPAQSPRVTVSYWDKTTTPSATGVERSFLPDAEGSDGVRSGPGELISSRGVESYSTSVPRDERGLWQADAATGQRGLDPNNRTQVEVEESVNDMVTRREIEERNQEVNKWLHRNLGDPPGPAPPPKDVIDKPNPNAKDDVPFGTSTENRYQPGQTYFLTGGPGGEIRPEDLQLMHANRTWGDAPLVPTITKKGTERYQPETSQAAISKFERLCQDNESIVSRAATWGTRRRSLPSILDDMEGLSGNFLKKLTLSREPRKPSGSLFGGFQKLVRKNSATLKRTLSSHDEEGFTNADGAKANHATPHLKPPQRTSSWNKKQPTPSINTALISMGQSVAAVGAGQAHSRNGSISATSITSPKSPLGGLTVRNPIRRPRSKSDLPRTSTKGSVDASHSNLADLWKKQGGPPVPNLTKAASGLVDMDDDDDDDDEFDDNEMKVESSKMIEDITPTVDGFQSHVLRLNPSLSTTNTYLVSRIGHQQVVRYKTLLQAKVKHLQQGGSCPCGALCISHGGSAVVLDQKGEPRGLDPMAGRFDGSDGDMTPVEGAITQESFPQDIPMPPTSTLPAEFECQLCFQPKKFNKPSDWTKHVHEDVQPFTCTWDRCREPKIFKRKADWVRHENEGHRHLEWWTCDVEECRHTCYRRDNFLQHLVREHKFPEPKVKTKAALKRAGGKDPTWQKVEDCHQETEKKPQEEPCRFCAKQFPTWKKLTVHLAKHMEQISLPVLRLVQAKELTPETIISPVQDPPPRTFNVMPPKQPPMMFATGPGPYGGGGQPHIMGGQAMTYHGNPSAYGYSVNQPMPANSFGTSYFNPQIDTSFAGLDSSLDMSAVTMAGFSPANQVSPLQGTQSISPQVANVPVTAAPYGGGQTYMPMSQPMDAAGFPALNGLSVQVAPHPQQQQQQPHGQNPHPQPSMMGGQVGYDSNGEGYTSHQGSVSPFTHPLSHSPHQSTANFDYYPQQAMQ